MASSHYPSTTDELGLPGPDRWGRSTTSRPGGPRDTSRAPLRRGGSDDGDGEEQGDDEEKLEEQEMRRVHTLPEPAMGEGPIAPKAAEEVVACAERERLGEVEGYIEPGWKGWLTVLGAVTTNMMCYGSLNSFGVFQEYYLSHQLSSSTPTAIAWIGSIELCLCPLLGCVVGPLFDAGYLKHLIGGGSALITFSLMMASLSSQYYQFLLSHGIGVGIAVGLLLSPSVGCVSHHFGRSRWRTFAYGLQAGGSSIAGIIYPILLRFLFPKVGFGWAMRIWAFMIAALGVISFFSLSTVHPPRKRLAILSFSVFRNRGYSAYVFGSSLACMAIYCPLSFAVTYATSIGIDSNLGLYLLAITNGASLIGRIFPLMFAQKTGTINVVFWAGSAAGVMLFCWTKARTVPSIIAFDAVFGVVSGAWAGSNNPSAAVFAPEPNQVGLYLGMCFFVQSFFWLPGVPITAALLRQGGTDYLPASMFCGAVVLLGSAIVGVSRWLQARKVGTFWV